MLFVISGAIAAFVNLISRFLFSQFLPFTLAVALSYIVGMTVAFILMSNFVFLRSSKKYFGEIFRFVIVNIISGLFVIIISKTMLALFVAFSPVTHILEFTAHAIGVSAPILLSYFMHRDFTFKS